MWFALFYGQSHRFHSARQAQLIRVIESISSSNANHVWTACINGEAPLPPCCLELWREAVLQSRVTAGVCYFWKLWQFQRSSRSHKALWKQLYRKEYFACHPAHTSKHKAPNVCTFLKKNPNPHIVHLLPYKVNAIKCISPRSGSYVTETSAHTTAAGLHHRCECEAFGTSETRPSVWGVYCVTASQTHPL